MPLANWLLRMRIAVTALAVLVVASGCGGNTPKAGQKGDEETITDDDAEGDGSDSGDLDGDLGTGDLDTGDLDDGDFDGGDLDPGDTSDGHPSAAATAAVVEERALDSGTASASDAEAATTTLTFDYGPDGPAASGAFAWSTSVTPAVSSAGNPVVFAIESNDLVGRENGQEVLRISQDSGNVTATLGRAIDHGSTNLVLSAPFTITDADGDTASSTFELTVTDDGPIATPQVSTASSSSTSANVLIVLQVSGGMANPSGLTGVTKLDLAREIAYEILARYSAHANVAVRLVMFSSTASAYDTAWGTADEIGAAIAAAALGGNTNFDAALSQAQSAFFSPGKLPDARNVLYFLSNGAPNTPSGSEGIDFVEQSNWQAFLSLSSITCYAIAVGSTSMLSELYPIAYDGALGQQLDAQLLTDPTLVEVPADPSQLTGNFFSGNTWGADEPGDLAALSIDGTTYNYDRVANVVSVVGTDRSTYDAGLHVLTVATVGGSSLAVQLSTSDFVLTTTGATITADYTLRDFDGDTASADATLEVLGSDGVLARSDRVYSNVSGAAATISVPYEAFMRNDTPASFAVGPFLGTDVVATTSNDVLAITDNDTDGGTVTYTATLNGRSTSGLIAVNRSQAGLTTLTGTGFADVLLGRTTNDTINGNEGDDWLAGYVGNDVLNGGDGDDVVIGGPGNDAINVSQGNDRIVFDAPTDGFDTIATFDGNPTNGQDTVDLRPLFTSLGLPPGSRAARVNVVIVSGTSTRIDLDIDGNGSFELSLVSLDTADEIVVGEDVTVD